VAKGVERGGIGFTALKGENRERGDSTSTNTRRNGGRIGIENGIWYTRNAVSSKWVLIDIGIGNF
jgi:hypothetical protein